MLFERGSHFVFLMFSWNSQYSPDWPGTRGKTPDLASQVLGSQCDPPKKYHSFLCFRDEESGPERFHNSPTVRQLRDTEYRQIKSVQKVVLSASVFMTNWLYNQLQISCWLWMHTLNPSTQEADSETLSQKQKHFREKGNFLITPITVREVYKPFVLEENLARFIEYSKNVYIPSFLPSSPPPPFFFWDRGLSVWSWLSCNSLYRTGWSRTHRDSPACASQALKLNVIFSFKKWGLCSVAKASLELLVLSSIPASAFHTAGPAGVAMPLIQLKKKKKKTNRQCCV